jgi:hypothetical protein
MQPADSAVVTSWVDRRVAAFGAFDPWERSLGPRARGRVGTRATRRFSLGGMKRTPVRLYITHNATEAGMTLQEAEAYFRLRIDELKQMIPAGTPWVFLCGTAVIEYLSKLAVGKDDGGRGFKKFVTDYMPDGYRNFKYKSGADDLPLQLYHILRCGIVHSFSLIPDPNATRNKGRIRSVVLSHDEPHLTSYSSTAASDEL